MDMSLSKLRELVMDREAWGAAIHEDTKSGTWLSDWTELMVLVAQNSILSQASNFLQHKIPTKNLKALQENRGLNS